MADIGNKYCKLQPNRNRSNRILKDIKEYYIIICYYIIKYRV